MGIKSVLLSAAFASAALLASLPAHAYDSRSIYLPGVVGNETQAAFFFSNGPANPGQALPDTTRVVVADPTGERPGTLTVDTQNRYLYLSQDGGQAMRYSVGVGREGFAWHGRAYVGRHAEWPTWTPPADMRRRRPDLPVSMVGGVDNPLGARAMYLYTGGRDTMFRIHGTSEPDTIGQAVSSGCIRMLNEDVIDLYDRVKIGSAVNVL